MEKLSFKVQEFEGPLDLLLHLIAKHKLNIYDIEISALLEQYLAYIEQMQRQDMEVASEFLEMAARLVHIKTVSLLPRHEEEQEELKRELSGELLEYQAVKEIAGKLSDQFCGFDLFVRETAKLPVDTLYTRSHQPEELLRAYDSVQGQAGHLYWAGKGGPKAPSAGDGLFRHCPPPGGIRFVSDSLYPAQPLSEEHHGLDLPVPAGGGSVGIGGHIFGSVGAG